MEKQKKRGRKPKGGKILEALPESSEATEVLQNVILHLKCFLTDLDRSLFADAGGIQPYTNEVCHMPLSDGNDPTCVQQKVKLLAANLRTNEISGRSDCFWCTCPYDAAPIYIPKYRANGQYQVYGSFCCPECAAGYLMADVTLDTSTRYERYHLLNYMYAGLGYKRNIVPAPPPHYLLSKFFGDLTITEYRKLIQCDTFVLVRDKPICCSYPEILQSNPEFQQPVLNSSKPEELTYRLCRKKR